MNTILWTPPKENLSDSNLIKFMTYVNNTYRLNIDSYNQLYNWSIDQYEDFWESYLKFSNIIYYSKYSKVVDEITKMPGAKWFQGMQLNFAENLLKYRDDKIAIRFYSENGNKKFISYYDLYQKVSGLSSALKNKGIKKGDRVCGYLPNIPETVIAMLATTSIGAIWSSCSPDFGSSAVIDRFKQIDPKIIFTVDSYTYNGKVINLKSKLIKIIEEINTIQFTVIIPSDNKFRFDKIKSLVLWGDFIDKFSTEVKFEQVAFDHPLYIMFSSGTTGLPKSIVHSVGGTLIQHLKELQLHTNLSRNDTIFYYTTCGWMMWNWLVSSLALGSTIVLYEGSPFYPDGSILHRISYEWGITVFGTSAKYITSLEKANIKPSKLFSYPRLKTILSTGSPLIKKNFEFVYTNWKKNVQLSSISGGTDIISCFVLGNPILPVNNGEIQCIGLGMKVESFDEFGVSKINNKGELVCTQAFPSMPIYFWNDPNQINYKSAYFQRFPKYWHHGDFIKINQNKGLVIYGRSDTTLNPGGVRIGTAEIYQSIDSLVEISDSLVVGHIIDEDEKIILFVQLKTKFNITNELIDKIKKTIRTNCSPKHIPFKIVQVKDIPYTLNGKKVELAVKQILQNKTIHNLDSIINPKALEYYKNII